MALHSIMWQSGTGQPVVFVYGGSADYRAWQDQLEVSSPRYRAISFSCRGYYPNERIDGNRAMPLETHMEDIASFLKTLDVAPLHLVSHSSPGGFGSLLLAKKYPTLLKSLVLIEPPAFTLLGINVPPKPPQIVKLFFRNPHAAQGERYGKKTSVWYSCASRSYNTPLYRKWPNRECDQTAWRI
jgi:pimeloyl-ACP methyl ester carboxylesterase